VYFSGGVFLDEKSEIVKPRHQRMIAIAAGVALIAVAAALVLNAFQGNVVFFFSPTQVAAKEAPLDKTFRVGGMVETGSVKRLPDGLTVQFVVTDTARSIPVVYTGILPDLFKEGKGVVTQGRLGPDGVFRATEVLAKHDENYMPPEAAHALSKAHAEKAARSVVTPRVGPAK
jgi:cytochrome c-type biogenesis protein CcmE